MTYLNSDVICLFLVEIDEKHYRAVEFSSSRVLIEAIYIKWQLKQSSRIQAVESNSSLLGMGMLRTRQLPCPWH